MLVKDWMAKDVLTIDENASVMRANRTMKENKIHRLPVLSHGKLVGVITDRDLRDASPSKSASLDIHEMNYLLSEMKVKEVMTRRPICMKGNDSLEKAALIMLDNHVSGILIVDDANHLAGLLSETDVLQAFIHCTGIRDGAIQFVFNMPDAPGSVTKLVDIFRRHDARMLSILTSFEDAPAGMKQVTVRVSLPEKEAPELHKELTKSFALVFFCKDELKDLPRKEEL